MSKRWDMMKAQEALANLYIIGAWMNDTSFPVPTQQAGLKIQLAANDATQAVEDLQEAISEVFLPAVKNAGKRAKHLKKERDRWRSEAKYAKRLLKKHGIIFTPNGVMDLKK